MKRHLSPSLIRFSATDSKRRIWRPFDEPAETAVPRARVDLTLGEGPGELLGYNDWGEWRTVPGFDEDKLQMSDEGYYRVRFKGGWTAPSKGSLYNRHHVVVDGFRYLVARLVCRTFHGPAPSAKHEADHIDRNPTNNKASNLRWASKTENCGNRREIKKSKSTGQPILIRKLDWPEGREWERFESALAAAKAYGLDSRNLSAVAHTRAGTQKWDAAHQHKGFIAEWAPPKETQDDLEAYDDSNLLEPPLAAGDSRLSWCPEAEASTKKEEWCTAPGVDNLCVSTRGRVQIKNPRGGWGPKRTPQVTDGQVYAMVNYKGKKTSVHILVHLTFIGPVPEGCSVDHKVSSRKFDNRLVNLRSATRSEQSTNRDFKPPSEINNSLKKAVWGKPVGEGEEAWERFESTAEAQRALHARFPDKSFRKGSISACARGNIPTAYGWVFQFA